MSLQSLIASGTKLWLDSVDPDLVQANFAAGATGATSNPAIISDLVKSGRFDGQMQQLMVDGMDNEAVAWALTDQLVSEAEVVFQNIWNETGGDDGYVSFELNPLLECPGQNLPHAQRVAEYIQLGKRWSAGHPNRMIKVPATPAGLDSLEQLAAAGVPLNVTLIFTERQCEAARKAIWRGAQRLENLEKFKSVYSVFVSRIDVYTEQEVPDLSSAAQGMVGIVNAKQLWQSNVDFWSGRSTPLRQEVIFASTGIKKPTDDAWKYVAALAGSDIETNPPKTNTAADKSGVIFTRQVDKLPAKEIMDEIASKVDFAKMEGVLMEQGIKKFADPQHALLALIEEKRGKLHV